MTYVLIVDDDPSFRDTVADVLEDMEMKSHTVGNGAEALKWLEAESPPCLILLDLMMPVMNGWDFLAARAKDPALESIPVVVLSASHESPKDVDAVLTKPLNLDKLLDTVKRYC